METDIMVHMPRNMRVECLDAICPVISLGDGRRDICLEDVDRQDCLKTLGAARQKTGFQGLAYGLRRNHFRAVLETSNANLVSGVAGRRNPVKCIVMRVRPGTSKSASRSLQPWTQAHPEPAAKPRSATAAKKHEVTK